MNTKKRGKVDYNSLRPEGRVTAQGGTKGHTSEKETGETGGGRSFLARPGRSGGGLL